MEASDPLPPAKRSVPSASTAAVVSEPEVAEDLTLAVKETAAAFQPQKRIPYPLWRQNARVSHFQHGGAAADGGNGGGNSGGDGGAPPIYAVYGGGRGGAGGAAGILRAYHQPQTGVITALVRPRFVRRRNDATRLDRLRIARRVFD